MCAALFAGDAGRTGSDVMCAGRAGGDVMCAGRAGGDVLYATQFAGGAEIPGGDALCVRYSVC